VTFAESRWGLTKTTEMWSRSNDHGGTGELRGLETDASGLSQRAQLERADRTIEIRESSVIVAWSRAMT